MTQDTECREATKFRKFREATSIADRLQNDMGRVNVAKRHKQSKP